MAGRRGPVLGSFVRTGLTAHGSDELATEVLIYQTSTARPPTLNRFLDYWERELEGALHTVRVAHHRSIRPSVLGPRLHLRLAQLWRLAPPVCRSGDTTPRHQCPKPCYATLLEREPTDDTYNRHVVPQRKACPMGRQLGAAEFTSLVRPVRPGAADDPGGEANYEQDYWCRDVRESFVGSQP